MLDVVQFRREIIRPALEAIGLYSPEAEDLVLGTALQESRLTYLVQLKQGPARGLFQCEKFTHDDVWLNYLRYNVDLAVAVRRLALTGQPYSGRDFPDAEELVWNLRYAAAMCRVHYRRQKPPLPTTLEGQAEYWDKYYNRNPAKGFPHEYIENWRRAHSR